jgi:hypothetical protein
MKNFKGQAALEFMMTYGWAILVVLAAIGALSYFGVLNPARFTPETCLASSGFACPGKPLITDTNLTFTVVNGMGFPITLNGAAAGLTMTNLNCTNAGVEICAQGVLGCGTTTLLVQDGAGATVSLTDCGFTTQNVVKGDLAFTYINGMSSLPETLTVTVTARPK